MTEAKYEIRFVPGTNSFHFRAWLEENGARVFAEYSGCSIATHRFDRNRKDCEKKARKACDTLLRRHATSVAAGDPVVKTVTPGGRPAYDDVRARIAQLERELEIA